MAANIERANAIPTITINSQPKYIICSVQSRGSQAHGNMMTSLGNSDPTGKPIALKLTFPVGELSSLRLLVSVLKHSSILTESAVGSPSSRFQRRRDDLSRISVYSVFSTPAAA